MTQTAVRVTTTVLHGKRIKVTAPELMENDSVELIILRSEAAKENTTAPAFSSALEYLDSLPRITRTPEEWAQIERELREERNA